MEELSFGEIIRLGVIAGVIGTLGMTIVLEIITRSKWANADMVRAIGSIFTKKYETSFGIGLIIHMVVGIIIGIIYTVAITSFNLSGFIDITAAAGTISVFHGSVVSMLLVISVAEHHPLERFRQTGFAVAVAHLAAHLVYGTLIGITIGLLV